MKCLNPKCTYDGLRNCLRDLDAGVCYKRRICV